MSRLGRQKWLERRFRHLILLLRLPHDILEDEDKLREAALRLELEKCSNELDDCSKRTGEALPKWIIEYRKGGTLL